MSKKWNQRPGTYVETEIHLMNRDGRQVVPETWKPEKGTRDSYHIRGPKTPNNHIL